MLQLSKKPCHLGNSMSTNCEKHGEEDVGAIDLPLDGIVLNKTEIDALLGDGAHAAIYRTPSKDAMPEARFPLLKPFAFKDHFEHATVTLEIGIDGDRFVLSDCKVRNVQLTTQAGGLTLMKCSIRSTPDSDTVAALYDHLNTDGMVQIEGAKPAEPKKGKQKDLPLGEGEDEEGEQDKAA